MEIVEIMVKDIYKIKEHRALLIRIILDTQDPDEVKIDKLRKCILEWRAHTSEMDKYLVHIQFPHLENLHVEEMNACTTSFKAAAEPYHAYDLLLNTIAKIIRSDLEVKQKIRCIEDVLM